MLFIDMKISDEKTFYLLLEIGKNWQTKVISFNKVN